MSAIQTLKAIAAEKVVDVASATTIDVPAGAGAINIVGAGAVSVIRAGGPPGRLLRITRDTSSSITSSTGVAGRMNLGSNRTVAPGDEMVIRLLENGEWEMVYFADV